MADITREVLRDYLNDALPDAELASVEKALRDRADVRALFAEVREATDRGDHSVGAVWRRERVSCPTREQLGNHLLDALDPDLGEYIAFHLTVVGCPDCQANLDDLRQKQAEPPATRVARRRKIVESSAGVLRKSSEL